MNAQGGGVIVLRWQSFSWLGNETEEEHDAGWVRLRDYGEEAIGLKFFLSSELGMPVSEARSSL